MTTKTFQEITGAAGPLGRLQFNTLGGNDTVNVNVGNTDLVTAIDDGRIAAESIIEFLEV